MCTLTFLPISGGFILTSNRDELVKREQAIPPQAYFIHNQQIYFPKDPKAGGSWIAAGAKHCLCLMNGAFKTHIPKPPYRLSRGRMLLDFFKWDNINKFCTEYDFKGIENFSMILIKGTAEDLHEIRWDGQTLTRIEHELTEPKLWASATLYPDELIRKRREYFFEHLQEKHDSEQAHILNFHRMYKGDDAAKRVCLIGNDRLRTVSISSISRTVNAQTIHYEDTISQEKMAIELMFED